MRGRIVLTASIVLALLAPGPASAAELPQAPINFVTDRAGVLSEPVEAELNAKLETFETETSNQVVVYIDRLLPEDRELEDFAADAFQAWDIGQEDRDNGVLFVVFTQDRRTRIEVGYGLEGALPDALAAQVLEEQAIPRFRESDWEAGVGDGVDGIIAATKGEYTGTGEDESQDDSGADSDWLWFLGFLILIQLVQWLWRRFRPRRFRGGRTYGSGGWWLPGLVGGWGGGSSRGGFSGGGFSGGGGMSGGGGASGSW
ncbi:MAG: TPM domain-containing protein [Actinomycetota bacterium]